MCGALGKVDITAKMHYFGSVEPPSASGYRSKAAGEHSKVVGKAITSLVLPTCFCRTGYKLPCDISLCWGACYPAVAWSG
jgi:hypothetical protein